MPPPVQWAVVYVLGADEAGKGPVLGPLVAAAVRAPGSALPAGVDDSKRLSAERREELAAELRSDADISVAVAAVGTDRIDDPATDMNGLTVAAHAEAVAAVGSSGDAAVVDAGDVDAARFGQRVDDRVAERGVSVSVDAEHGADAAHAHAAAASVVAKVERDRRIDDLRDRYGVVGSGYPSDPATREFLRSFVRDHGRLPACARRSWATSRDLLAAAEQSALSEF